MSTEYEPVIGLEVHIQLKTVSKLFCSCPTTFGAIENTQICPVCCGYPGSLPVLNKGALGLALRIALGLHCRINPTIIFERKNYFYPDLPKNYQISQYAMPLGENGFLDIERDDGSKKRVQIKRVHMEEDAGKLVHAENCSFVDYNRTGVPLAEIVTDPDIESPDEAYAYLTELKMIARHLGVSECDMEKGFLRCDANVSVRKKGERELGVKTELKNMNSFKGVRDALEYEIQRQIGVVRKGGAIVQSTLLWDDTARKTVMMRTKEEAHDYRYFPDPDLVIFDVEETEIQRVQRQIVQHPQELRSVLVGKYGLSAKQASFLMQEPWLSQFFVGTAVLYADPKKIYNVLSGHVMECVNSSGKEFSSIVMSPQHFVTVLSMIDSGSLNNLTSKELIKKILFDGGDPQSVAQQSGLIQISGEDQLIGLVDRVIKDHPKPVADFINGKEQALMFLIGQVMKEMKGKANPKVLRDLFERRIHNG